jgi:hypothetical protein
LIDLPEELEITFKYLIPIAVFLISVFVMPKFVFKVSLKAEGHERKSQKEESYVLKNMFYMVCNTLLAPIFACCLFAAVHYNYDKANPAEGANKFPDKVPAPVVGFQLQTGNLASRVDNFLNEYVASVISESEEYFTRYILQMTLGILFCHLILKPAVLDRMYH